jgi:renalase
MKIAIIGAGISGLTLANQLNDAANVTVFEKARGVGGRMSTRYADPHQFDHGAQFFTARSTDFKSFLAPYIGDGVVAEWTPKILTLEAGKKPYKRDWFEPHYVGVPKMNSLCKAMSDAIDVRVATRIETMEWTDGQWRLTDTQGNVDTFDWVLSSVPSPQLLDLFPNDFEGYDEIRDADIQACFTMMVGFDDQPKLNWDAATIKNSCLEWAAINNSKQGRDMACSITVHSSNAWADANVDRDINDIQSEMLAAFMGVTGIDAEPSHVATHRWLYAYSKESETENQLRGLVHCWPGRGGVHIRI